MAKRKASGKTPSRKTRTANKAAASGPAPVRETAVGVSEPSVDPLADDAPIDGVEPSDEQPAAAGEPPPRPRKKRANAEEPPPHWRVAETADEPAPVPEPEPIPHLAKCGECAVSVRFTVLPSGHGITVLEAGGVDLNTSFGLGDSGNPICPNGHGEMRLADEQMPAAEAITQVASKVNGAAAPTQAQLFEMAQPFNFEGAWMDIEVKNGVVAELARVYEDDAARAKRSRKALEEAQTLLSRMIETYHERRVKKAREAQSRIEMAAAHAEPAATEPAIATTSEPVPAADEATEPVQGNAPPETVLDVPDVTAVDALPPDDDAAADDEEDDEAIVRDAYEESDGDEPYADPPL